MSFKRRNPLDALRGDFERAGTIPNLALARLFFSDPLGWKRAASREEEGKRSNPASRGIVVSTCSHIAYPNKEVWFQSCKQGDRRFDTKIDGTMLSYEHYSGT
jgi:hypothetical protein